MTREQEDAIWAAYLGICVLQRMCHKAELQMAGDRSKELLVELASAFPFIQERVANGICRVTVNVV
jgi:hypothetical protein